MIRFILLIALNIPAALRYFFKMIIRVRKKNRYVEKDYKLTRKIVKVTTRRARVNVETYGEENLPENGGFFICPNHQGRFDGLAMMNAMTRPFSIVINSARSDLHSFEKLFMDILGAARLDVSEPKSALQTIRQMSDDIRDNGRIYCFFPEGGYNNNGNTLQTFRTGCLHFIQDIKCPIVPVCLYDSYKVFNTNSLKRIKCQVHFLKPIEYSEYEGLRKHEIAEMIKSRIQEKLDLLNADKEAVNEARICKSWYCNT